MNWTTQNCEDKIYSHKFNDVVRIISEWFEAHGGVAGKDVLEFGCGEATVALGLALQKKPQRLVGVEILDVVFKCADYARKNLGLETLPNNLELYKIEPGQRLTDLGTFDFIYTWSVFEHVRRDTLQDAFRSIADVLRPGGVVFLQISPLFYSRDGSHLAPWINQPWGHLSMEHDVFKETLWDAPATPEALRKAWSVYIPLDADQEIEQQKLWETYVTLNKTTAPQLERAAADAGLQIIRDYRTKNDDAIPLDIAEIYDEDTLRTEQIVWLLTHNEPTS